ncbi:putative surface presentation of antigens (spoa) protein [Roseibium sp. TrichSKD4]|uniref:FliM/FliN family flagellar motor switch protein n=1 Tax=Roseibium sp. TrichSKD4 TaxID=744980 RepID=UPI0001E56A8F|nr:FliM/FliN family flagellar motor switch protein [Roseibium sp. TrichSKD4]EFO31931.1 putative surface presentation of antigens (spoa) protein [Roseibium sp. TrichSKD4]
MTNVVETNVEAKPLIFRELDDARSGKLPIALNFYRKPLRLIAEETFLDICVDNSTGAGGEIVVNFLLNETDATISVSQVDLERLCQTPLFGLSGVEQALIVEDSAGAWVERFEKATGMSVRTTEVLPANEASRDFQYTCNLSIRWLDNKGNQAETLASLSLSDEALEHLTSLLEKQRSKNDVIEDVRLNCCNTISLEGICLEELKKVAVGDAIVLGELDEFRGVLVEGRMVFPALQEGSELIIDGDLQEISANGPTEMTNKAGEENMGEGAAGKVDEIKVNLVVSAGELQLPIGELRELETGSVLRLPVGQPGNVNLMVNGQKIGEGVLVTISGQTAVEISKLGNSIA